MVETIDKPSRCTREVLVEQILWLIRLRWIAVGGIVAAVAAQECCRRAVDKSGICPCCLCGIRLHGGAGTIFDKNDHRPNDYKGKGGSEK